MAGRGQSYSHLVTVVCEAAAHGQLLRTMTLGISGGLAAQGLTNKGKKGQASALWPAIHHSDGFAVCIKPFVLVLG